MKKKINLDELLSKPTLQFEQFHSKTKIKKPITEIKQKLWPESWKKVYYKGYARLEEIILPRPKLPKGVKLKEALSTRVSRRKFSGVPISLKKLSTLLYFSAGLKKTKLQKESNRFYPSAGSRYPLEIYILSLNTELPRGLYHYYLKSNSLEKLLTFSKFSPEKYFGQSWVAQASCLIIITAIFRRNCVKYSNRGYRYVMIEVGHMGQNFYLNSAALDIACCTIGGFADKKLEKLLDIDGVKESVVYILAIGEMQSKVINS